MKRLLYIVMMLALLMGCRERLGVSYKYHLGEKVLMKTGDVGVIIKYSMFQTYIKGYNPPEPKYQIRIGFSKKTSITDSLINGVQSRFTDVTKFWISEFEIEKKIQ